MTILWICLAIAAVSYLLGSIMFGVIISRRFYHDDIRTHGSGSAGIIAAHSSAATKRFII